MITLQKSDNDFLFSYSPTKPITFEEAVEEFKRIKTDTDFSIFFVSVDLDGNALKIRRTPKRRGPILTWLFKSTEEETHQLYLECKKIFLHK